jgi:hypothetical protein
MKPKCEWQSAGRSGELARSLVLSPTIGRALIGSALCDRAVLYANTPVP